MLRNNSHATECLKHFSFFSFFLSFFFSQNDFEFGALCPSGHKSSNTSKFQTASTILQEGGHTKAMKCVFLIESGEISDQKGISIYSTPLCTAVAVGQPCQHPLTVGWFHVEKGNYPFCSCYSTMTTARKNNVWKRRGCHQAAVLML